MENCPDKLEQNINYLQQEIENIGNIQYGT